MPRIRDPNNNNREPLTVEELMEKFGKDLDRDNSPASSPDNTPTKRERSTITFGKGGTKRRRTLRKMGKRNTKKAKRTFRRK